MAIRITVGTCRKIGLENFSSAGANCSMEIEVDAELLHGNQQVLAERIRRAYEVCNASVNDQLESSIRDKKPTTSVATGGVNTIQQPISKPTNGETVKRPATESQRRAIVGMASRQGINIEQLILQRFGIGRISDLDLWQASQLISSLREASQPQPVAS